MNVLIAFLAVTGALAWLMVISGFIFGVFFRTATAEDRAVVDLPDVDLDARLEPFVGNVRVIGWAEQAKRIDTSAAAIEKHYHRNGDPAAGDACAGLDRSGF